MKRHILWAVLLVLASFSLAQAQGTQTGTISGTVESSDGLAFPGVSVTAKSPALQGTRTAVTDANGNYIFPALPPGSYTITFEVSGMQTVERKVNLELGRAITVNTALAVAGVSETVNVTGELPNILETPSGGANIKAAEVDTLATGRTVAAMAEIQPGLTDNTPNVGQVSIAGAMAYDNVFLVDGVDVNDNLFGTANNLFIEEAIEEQQVLTSGISAEYGRFSGGIINTVTKRGGNDFSGAFRANFSNPTWTDETPYEKERDITRTGDTNRTYEATLGGPVLRDKLWFFVAGRRANTETSNVWPDLGEPVTTSQENQRYIVKLTGTIAKNHTVSGTYTNNATDQGQPAFGFASSGLRSIDPRTFINRTLPNDLFNLNYNGVLSSNLFAEVQYSQKTFTFENSGGTGSNLADNSPFLTQGAASGIGFYGHYNAPYFDANDPEDRNNRQVLATLSYFLSTGKYGRHDIKVGYENFRTTRTGGNSQSPTNYVFYADYLASGGQPVLSNGRYQPVWVPETSARTFYLPTLGAELDITTQTFFVNDRWQINRKLSANIGARLELVNSEASGGIVAVDTTTLVPRLALSYDVLGNDKVRLDATYARYAGKYNDTQIGNNSTVGNPSYVYSLYVGPEGVGTNFAPAYDESNWVPIAGGIPTANIFVADDLHSPTTNEFTFGVGFTLPKNGYLKAVFTNRSMSDFIENFIDTTTGSTVATLQGLEVGPFDNIVYRNSDLPTREYQGLTLQTGFRPTSKWSINANYTHQFKNEGDFEGEARNQPGISSTWGNYPELYVMSRNNPIGRLSGYQAHKIRAWSWYDVGLGKAGRLTPSIMYRYDSPLTYSHTAASVPFSAYQRGQIAGLGYTSPPANQTIFFGERGSQEFASTHLLDLALSYDVNVFKGIRPWFKLELYNALNNDKLVTWNTTVSRNTAGPVDQYGLPTQFTKGTNYGKATSNANFATPRTFQFSVGFRF